MSRDVLDGWHHLESDDKRLPHIKKCGELMSHDECIRLYDGEGKHLLSLLRCHTDGGFDLATPDGGVQHCDGADKDELIQHLIQNGHLEQI